MVQTLFHENIAVYTDTNNQTTSKRFVIYFISSSNILLDNIDDNIAFNLLLIFLMCICLQTT